MTGSSARAQALQDRILLGMTEAQRLTLAFEMSDLTRNLALAGIQMRNPGWSDAECRRELLRYAFLPRPLPPGLP